MYDFFFKSWLQELEPAMGLFVDIHLDATEDTSIAVDDNNQCYLHISDEDHGEM